MASVDLDAHAHLRLVVVEAGHTEDVDASLPDHFCQAHNVPFQRRDKGDKAWYSHKAPDGTWCNEH
jgi:hypothetical protein